MNRIVSLIASSTETICALGYEDSLVGRSHECDYPPSIRSLPVCSEPMFDIEGTSKEIDERVRLALKGAGSVYRTHVDVLKALDPTVIVTQDHCEVCAVVLKDVETAVSEALEGSPRIVSLAPESLDNIYLGMIEIAEALGDAEKGRALVASMKRRIESVASKVTELSAPMPTVACVEWVEPLMVAGNWMPELVELAGGVGVLGPRTSHSATISVEQLRAADPDRIVVMLCGWDIEKSREEFEPILGNADWGELRAVREGEVYYTNGNHYFNRPGPRLADSAEILAEILYPKSFGFGYEGFAWVKR